MFVEPRLATVRTGEGHRRSLSHSPFTLDELEPEPDRHLGAQASRFRILTL
jgi:hypothetical protein